MAEGASQPTVSRLKITVSTQDGELLHTHMVDIQDPDKDVREVFRQQWPTLLAMEKQVASEEGRPSRGMNMTRCILTCESDELIHLAVEIAYG